MAEECNLAYSDRISSYLITFSGPDGIRTRNRTLGGATQATGASNLHRSFDPDGRIPARAASLPSQVPDSLSPLQLCYVSSLQPVTTICPFMYGKLQSSACAQL
jgi:hypothetical protein